MQRTSTQTQPNNAALITRLVRSGLMPAKDLPALKIAMMRHQKVGDMAKLPRNQRDVLSRYNAALSSAAYGSQQSFSALRRNVQDHYEFTREDFLSEQLSIDPPMMMILKRKGIRIFPDGRRVALYTNDKLGITITVPYVPGSTKDLNPVVGVTEEIMESFEQLQKYASQEEPKSKSRHFKFADGTKMPVAHGAAKAMHMVHGALNPENQKKYQAMLSDPKGFKKAADFALSRVQFSINK